MTDALDRYPIPPNDGPAQLKEWMRGIERRLRELEGARPLTFTTVTDDQGNVVVRIGRLADDGSRPDGTWGIALFSVEGPRFEIGTEGWILPRLPYILTDPDDVKAITSGTFVDAYISTSPVIEGRGVEVLVPWLTEPGTAGEVRITSNIPSQTVPIALPANSSGVYFARWLHGGTIGTGPLELRTQVRRTGGAGNVWIWPTPAYVQNPVVCDSDGNWAT